MTFPITESYESFRIVSTAPANGARAVICRPDKSEDTHSAVEFALVDIAFWGIDERGVMTAYIFDAELGCPIRLKETLFNYAGDCGVSGVLESKASVLSKDDMDRFEQAVRRKQTKFIAHLQSPEAEAFRAQIRKRMGYSQLSA